MNTVNFFFFFLSVKRCILKKKKTVLCKKTQHIKDYNEKEKRKIEKKTNYKKEREIRKGGRESLDVSSQPLAQS